MTDACDRLRWLDPLEPLTEEALASVEAHFGVKLPPLYRECLRKYHGTSPEVCDFPVHGSDGRSFGSCIGVLLTADREASENIFTTHEHLGDLADPRLIPISDDGGG